MTVTITLTNAGGDTGPFNLYSNATSYLSAFDTNVPKASLVSGFTTSNVPDGTTTIRVVSIGTCTNHIDIPVDAPVQCLEFIFQGAASIGNTVTFKDCATGNLTEELLNNGKTITRCAYSDPFSYPVFIEGSGTILPGGTCGSYKGCTQYTLFAFPGEGGATFRYIPCNESDSIDVPVVDGTTEIICANPIFAPQLITGSGSATDTLLGCSTTTTTSSSSTTTTTSSTTSPP